MAGKQPLPPEDPQSDFARYGPRIVQEKLRVVKLIRALDRARIDPRGVPALQQPLIKLAEYDQMLTSSLEAIEWMGRKGSELGPALEGLLGLGERVRGDVSDVVPAGAARRLRDGLAEVAATEAEARPSAPPPITRLRAVSTPPCADTEGAAVANRLPARHASGTRLRGGSQRAERAASRP